MKLWETVGLTFIGVIIVLTILWYIFKTVVVIVGVVLPVIGISILLGTIIWLFFKVRRFFKKKRTPKYDTIRRHKETSVRL